MALYSSSFELVARQAKDTAGALLRSIGINQFSVSESANLIAQIPLRRSLIEKHVATPIHRPKIIVADDDVETGVALVSENPLAELVGDTDEGGDSLDVGEPGEKESAQTLLEQLTNVQMAAQSFEAGAADPFYVETASAVVEAVGMHEQIFLVRFGFDSAELDENSLTTIRRAIDAMQDRFEGVAIVAGYSDPLGSTAYNLELSRKRAQAVADSLLALGVSGDRLRVEGRGTYAALEVKANEEPLELGRIAQIIIEESSKW